MTRRMLTLGLGLAAVALPAWAAESAADRGRKALLEKNYNPAVWTRTAYDEVWKRWPGELWEDVPAGWLLKKKKTMYHTGGGDARSVRSLMQFMMSPTNGPAAFAKAEADFADILQYFLTLEAPKYPFPVDVAVAARGK